MYEKKEMNERDEVIDILLDFGLDLDTFFSIPDLPFNDAFAASAGTNYEHTHFDDFQPNKGDGMYRKKKDFFFFSLLLSFLNVVVRYLV